MINATGIHFHAAVFDIKVEKDVVTNEIEDARDGLEIIQDGETIVITESEEIFLARRLFSIIPLNVEYLERCPLPLDKIGG